MNNFATKVKQVIDDPFMKDFANEDFNPTDYISKVSGTGEVKNMVDVYFSLTEKEKSVDSCLSLLATLDQDFFESQFSIPKKYGVG